MRPQKNTANLFVVGAMRAGTTSFMEMLSQHPEVYVSPIKEPHFFVEELPSSLYENRPFFSLEDYFRNEFPQPLHRAKLVREEQYEMLFSLAKGEKYLAEGSVSYLQSPGTAQKIYDYNPNAKVIIITRDPLERAFSHYKMDLGLLREKADFETLLSKQVDLYHTNSLPWYSHLAMSFYNKPIKEYRRYFGENLLVVSFEDFTKSPSEALKKLSSFLGIEFLQGVFPRRNETKKVKFSKPLYALKKLGLFQVLSAILPSSIKASVKSGIYSKNTDSMSISEPLYKEITAIFKTESFSGE